MPKDRSLAAPARCVSRARRAQGRLRSAALAAPAGGGSAKRSVGTAASSCLCHRNNSAVLPPGRVWRAPARRRSGTKAPAAAKPLPSRAASSLLPRWGGSSSPAPRPLLGRLSPPAPPAPHPPPAAAPARPSQAPERKCRARPGRGGGSGSGSRLSAAPA